MVTNKTTTGRSKHIDIRFQYAKQVAHNEKIEVYYVSTDSNIADLFMKPLGRLKFRKFASALFKDMTMEEEER